MESPDETSPDEFICKPLNNFMANLLLAAKRNLEDTESATMNTEPTASQSNKPWESHSEKIHDATLRNVMVTTETEFEDLDVLQKNIYEQLLVDTYKVNNSKKPEKPRVLIKQADVFIKSLRPLNAWGVPSATHLLIHFGGGSVTGRAVAEFLDNEKFAYPSYCENALVKCETDSANQKRMLEFISGPGETLEIGKLPNDTMLKDSLLKAAYTQIVYQRGKVQRRQDLVDQLQENCTVSEREVSRLQAQVAALSAENTKLQESAGNAKRMRVEHDAGGETIDKIVDLLIEKDREIAQKEKKIAAKDKKLALKDEQLGEKDFCIEMKDRQLVIKDEQLSQKDELLERKALQLDNERDDMRRQVAQATYDARCDLVSERRRAEDLERKLRTMSDSLGRCSQTLTTIVHAIGRDSKSTLQRKTAMSKQFLGEIKKNYASYDWSNVLAASSSDSDESDGSDDNVEE